MPLSWVRAKFGDFRSQVLDELANELEVEVSEDLVEALAAATSLVAFADGVASPEEREELLSVFEEEDRLTEIDLDDLFDAFDDYAERFAEDATAAESEALTAVGVFDDLPDLGRLVVRAALVVGTTDGALNPPRRRPSASSATCSASSSPTSSARSSGARTRTTRGGRGGQE